jgi:phosphoglycerate dehydrogenase-like enzyme
VLVLPSPSLYQELFSPEADAALRELAEVTFNPEERNWSAEDVAEVIGGYDAVITGWGSPAFDETILDQAGRLRLLAHSAGSVKGVAPPVLFERGVAVTSAAIAMAPAVAEFALIFAFLGLRPIHKYDQGMRQGDRWDGQKAFGPGQEIAGQRIGVIGASMVGRHFIGLVRALGAEVLVYDPYLSDEGARALGAHQADLATVMAECPIVSIHAPTTPETRHMIGAPELALLPDNAFLVNTARSWVIDMDALLAELQPGRIRAALDVYDQEPLPADSPFRRLDNVILTPHIAGATAQARFRQGQTVVDELRRFFAGEPLRYEVTKARLAILA